ncbi:D-Ala-D-Ala carboxypeptidase family metallohydrolase [Kangiella sp. TOML190]|uniref:D-Ala-D-Ala carboxypeptidase family metallohydrolase n=1 Tax=Kangiella sp. TOML190 TaxID=2931351 RepID=UPI00203B5964|nr:D-Ala-D-Ala carboxypeptidase family metallohydrolase [Kangiella sp. TOML190]
MNKFSYGLVAILLLTVTSSLSAQTKASANKKSTFDKSLAPFMLKVDQHSIPYKRFMHSALPGQVLEFEKLAQAQIELYVESNDYSEKGKDETTGEKLQWNNNKAQWQLPNNAGNYRLVARGQKGQSIELTVFVLEPAANIRKGKLNGYAIGAYPKALRGLASYQAPQGFIKVTPENKELYLSPHFQLKQFLCKQKSGYPKYLVVKKELVWALENLLAEVNGKGLAANRLVVMSGYRTPSYNKVIGSAKHSRHLYGDAADVYLDVSPVDGVMDDINADGKVNKKDAQQLYRWAEELGEKLIHDKMVGGLGAYKANAYHGPFLHLDLRGYKARW